MINRVLNRAPYTNYIALAIVPSWGLLIDCGYAHLFVEVQPQLNLWWRDSPALAAAFRRRLGEARNTRQIANMRTGIKVYIYNKQVVRYHIHPIWLFVLDPERRCDSKHINKKYMFVRV